MAMDYHQMLVIFEHKKYPAEAGNIQKNYKKNMKTLTNRIRKLLAYLYYSKKAAQKQV